MFAHCELTCHIAVGVAMGTFSVCCSWRTSFLWSVSFWHEFSVIEICFCTNLISAWSTFHRPCCGYDNTNPSSDGLCVFRHVFIRLTQNNTLHIKCTYTYRWFYHPCIIRKESAYSKPTNSQSVCDCIISSLALNSLHVFTK